MSKKIEETFFETLKRLDIEAGKYFAAVSGGLDSTAMLYLLSKFADNLNIEIIAVHVHHHIRGKEADEDALFVKTVANQLGINFLLLDIYPPPGANEDVLRSLRYDAISAAMDEWDVLSCFTAHTASDVAETVLMRLSEGAGVRGLGGIPERQGRFLRPMLGIFRKELMDWAYINGITWVEDSMNKDLKYKRVRSRKIALPAFSNAFGEFAEHNLVESAKFCAEAYQALKELLPVERFEIQHGIYNIDALLELSDATLSLAVKFILESFFPGYPPRRELIKRTLEIVRSKNPHAVCPLGKGCIARREYNRLVIECDDKASDRLSNAIISRIGVYDLGVGFLHVSDSKPKRFDGDVYAVSLKERPFPWIVRERRSGDKMSIVGHSSKKRLSRIFIDKKIPHTKRNMYPVIESNGEIFVVPAIASSENGNPPDVFVWFERSGG